ncbi:ABC transporter substrate-binding protein [Gordonibacter sp. 28C]|uniref:ABC transporter substrate-binding protein n=1 Tax=Gordonibacter sp. 28C TaxID=2078569 RepID=UPI001314BE53|nr:ABC transporter substrate-binding protein [Gordonibacter sp. 28C]
MKKYDLSDADRAKLDYVLSVHGPGMKEVSLASNAFVARYNKTHDRPLKGGHGSLAHPDPNYADLSLVEDPAKLPDVVGGMGFGEFFGRAFIDRHVLGGRFRPVPYPAPPIPLFDGVDLVDRTGSYHIYGGSAFDFLVDERKLEGRPVPRRWEDLLDPRYRGMVVCGFNIDDINEVFLLYFYQRYGLDGVAAFADNLAAPIDTLDIMRTSLRQRNCHAVYLLPHFFSTAAPHEEHLLRVWPDDGALLAPYFFLVQRDGGERADAIVDFFFGEGLARALTSKEMFHVYSSGLGNEYEHRRFKWLGWDWLLERDIVETMRAIDAVAVPRVLKRHPELEKDIGRALWNG